MFISQVMSTESNKAEGSESQIVSYSKNLWSKYQWRGNGANQNQSQIKPQTVYTNWNLWWATVSVRMKNSWVRRCINKGTSVNIEMQKAQKVTQRNIWLLQIRPKTTKELNQITSSSSWSFSFYSKYHLDICLLSLEGNGPQEKKRCLLLLNLKYWLKKDSVYLFPQSKLICEEIL